ncbi:MAG: hypothetical protein HXY18_18600 [Bryobacteraceae bacterium]|nr:hypothetical protein [Bryobacteraceae bacterium]
MSITKILALAGCLALLMAAPCMAQALRLNVPFAFQVGDKTLPSGDYVVNLDVSSHRITMNGETGEAVNTLFMTCIYPAQFDSRSALVFHRYGEDYFLRQVQTPGSSVSMPVSRHEKFVKRAANERRGPKMALVRVTVQ